MKKDTHEDALVRQLGVVLRDLDTLAARYRDSATVPPERRDAMAQMLAQGYHQVKLAADELALAYKGTV